VLRRLVIASSFIFIALLTQWLSPVDAIEFPLAKAPAQVYSNQLGDDLHLLFCEAFADAKRSIYLEMYAITDPTVLSILKSKSLHGTNLEVIADTKASPALIKKLGTEAHVQLYTGKHLMHRKVVVIDDELVLLGSANFTKASLKMHDNLVIAIRDQELGTFLEHSDSPSIYHREPISIWKLPEAGQEALEATCAALRSAQKTIRVAMFTFTHFKIAEELAHAKERGIDVQVALDHYTAEGSSKKICTFLISRGVPVFISQGKQLLHHKWALIDGTTLLTGSTNWTQSAYKRNKDISIKLFPIDEIQRVKIEKIWKVIQLEATEH